MAPVIVYFLVIRTNRIESYDFTRTFLKRGNDDVDKVLDIFI